MLSSQRARRNAHARARARARQANAPDVLLCEHLRLVLDELGEVRVDALKDEVQVLEVEEVDGRVIDAGARHVQQLDDVGVLQVAQDPDLRGAKESWRSAGNFCREAPRKKA